LFSVVTNFFFHSYQSGPLLRGDTKKNVKAVAYWEPGI
jgi:hypothetical protein